MGKTIGIVSLKGGVGKTSSVAALGAAMAEIGKKTLLIDGNFSAPNLGVHLDVLDPVHTIHDVLEGKIHLSEAIHELPGFNFHLVPASMARRQINPLKLKDKLKIVKRSYDSILLDSSPALNDETLAVMLASDYLLVVSTPDYATLGNTLQAIKLARQRGTPIAGLIINKVYGKRFELPIEAIENASGVPVMAVIPHDIKILEALSEARPSTVYRPNSKASKEYRKLAATLVGEKENPVKLKKFLRWVSPKQQEINREIFYNRVFG